MSLLLSNDEDLSNNIKHFSARLEITFLGSLGAWFCFVQDSPFCLVAHTGFL